MRSPVPWRMWWSAPSLMRHFYTHTRSGKFPPQEIRALQLQSGTRLDILFLSTPSKTAIFTSFEKYLSKQLAVKSQESSLLIYQCFIIARCLNKSPRCNMYRWSQKWECWVLWNWRDVWAEWIPLLNFSLLAPASWWHLEHSSVVYENGQRSISHRIPSICGKTHMVG